MTNKIREEVRQRESLSVRMKYEKAVSTLSNVSKDLMFLYDDSRLKNLNSAKTGFEETIKNLIKHKDMYQNIRFVDNSGEQIINVCNENCMTASSGGENISEYQYFRTLDKVSKNSVYLSRFDLVVENGKVVMPHTPILRFGIPVYKDKKRTGYLFIDFLGEYLLNILRTYDEASITQSQTLLINSDGYFLLSSQKEDEWGFMFEARKRATFMTKFPSEWKSISANDEGQIATPNGIFTYRSIRLAQMFHSTEEGWKIISHIPSRQLRIVINPHRSVFLLLLFSMVVFSVIIGLLIARVNIEREIARNSLKESERTDPLTLLHSRRSFYDIFDHEIRRANRNKYEIGIILGDIDNFKRVNDIYGHKIGDDALRIVADMVTAVLREQDAVCRWGGEEIVVLLPETGEEGTIIAAEKLRATLESNPIKIPDATIYLTMSLGITIYKGVRNGEECLESAKIALYEAKRLGGNKYIYDGMLPEKPENGTNTV